MASLTLSTTTLATSLGNLASFSSLVGDWLSLSNEMHTIASDLPTYSSSSTTASGKTTWANPVLDTSAYTGNIKELTGSYVETDSGTLSLNASRLTGEKSNGDVLTLTGTIKSTVSDTKQSIAYSLTKVAMTNANGTSHEITGKLSYSYGMSFTTGEETPEKFSLKIASLKSTDASGNAVTFTGGLTYSSVSEDGYYSYDLTTPSYGGTITGFVATIGGQKLTATKLGLTYNQIAAVTADNLDDYLPLLLTGNDTLTISSADPLGTTPVYGYAGNDKITGSTSDDILIGGAGADQLTGGSGADTFRFTALADLGTSTTTRDTLKDFKTSQSDKIDFSGMGTYTLYASTSVAALSDASNAVWFDKGVLYLSTDTDTDAEYQIALTGVTSIAATDFVSILSIT